VQVGNGKTRDVSSKFAEDLLALAAFKVRACLCVCACCRSGWASSLRVCYHE